MQAGLGISSDNLSWIINAYTLAFGGLLLLSGRIADLFGKARFLMVGIILFGVGCLGIALAQSMVVLVVLRAVQGTGAALITASALSILIASTQSGRERGLAMSAWGAVTGASAIVGLILGGALTDGPGWRWIFWITLPLLAIVFLGAWLTLRGRDELREAGRRLDVAGALTATAGIPLVLLAVVRIQQWPWGSTQNVALLLVGAALIGIFVLVEARGRDPLLPLATFRLPNVAAGNATLLFVGGAQVGTYLLLTLYLQEVLGFSALDAGLAFLPIAAFSVIGSALAPRCVERFGARAVICVGMLAAGGAMIWFSDIGAQGNFWTILWPSIPFSLGTIVAFVGGFIAGSARLGGPDVSGLSSGMTNTFNQIGVAVGVAVLTTVALNHAGSLVAHAQASAHSQAAAAPAAYASAPNAAGAHSGGQPKSASPKLPSFIAPLYAQGFGRGLLVGGIITISFALLSLVLVRRDQELVAPTGGP